MLKKLALGASAIALAVASVPMFAAFEAHIINVTARIENALTVDTTPINFGTVFPQEAIDKQVNVSLSGSFLQEGRVDDVDYLIRQKPKCQIDPGVEGPEYATVTDGAEGVFVCPQGYHQLPVLCPYLSKHETTADGVPDNDGGINAFHGPVTNWTLRDTLTTEVKGRLAKSEQDTSDTWNIDLRVPCFAGECAQDWATFVKSNNETADPAAYVQPAANKSVLFGCDLWIEVSGVSRTSEPFEEINIGDPTSESGHSLLSWGPIEPATHNGNWGGACEDGNCRVVYASQANGDGTRSATFTISSGPAGVRYLNLRNLDGIATDDSFEVYINGNLVASYANDGSIVSEVWKWSSVAIPVSVSGVMTVELKSTGVEWPDFGIFGQVAFTRILTSGTPEGTVLNP
ncbi:MAG: hypothetical protein PHI63_03560 [Patescibacteria group bacterium]|nr:hypothetical protein [Patescibacteria group bacterium]